MVLLNLLSYGNFLGGFESKNYRYFFGGDMSFELLGEMKSISVLRMERSSRARRRRKALRIVKNEVTERRYSKMRQLRQKYKKIRARHHDELEKLASPV